MNVYKPLRAGLFIYEIVRLFLLVVFMYLATVESGFLPAGSNSGGFFPCNVYLSSNALFPLMALFLWLKPEEYRGYLTLYMAGKAIAVVSFYV